MHRALPFGVAGLALAGSLIVGAAPAAAHPLGNYTINTYSGLRVSADGVAVDFVVDMAEVPTLQRKGQIDGATACADYGRRLRLVVDGRPVDLSPTANQVALLPGQAGLSTLRVECGFRARTDAAAGGSRTIAFSSSNFTDRVGWREITARGEGVTVVESNVDEDSASGRLTSYPDDLLSSPLDQRAARLVVRPGDGAEPAAKAGARAAPAVRGLVPRGVDRATSTFTSFVARQNLTVGFAIVAFAASVVLGAAHAFAPGHGKTVMAAYLVGQRGSYRHAMTIALTVTATHTVGVLALGIAVATSSVVTPERLYPWLGLATGVLLSVVGLGWLRRLRAVGRHAHGHHHDHSHRHDHSHPHPHPHPHPHDHDHDHDHGGGAPAVTRRGLVVMGFVGGLLPSPSAVVVLLGAMALGRAWFGVVLVVAYGLGMAAALAGTGLLMARASGAIRRLTQGRPHRGLVAASARMLPVLTAAAIVGTGVYLAAKGAAQI